MAKENASTRSATKRTRFPTILYTIAALICLVGLAEATYLTVMNLTGETAVCGGSASCFEVLGSKYAKIAGIPVAGLGAVAYFSAFTFATFAAFGYRRARTLFALTISAMFLATLWLLFVQAFLLHAFCRYCLFSAAMIFLLAGIVVSQPASD
jgi:uncharacterized membrane protein